jgi:phospholipid transport system substrate-binding protein
MRDGVVGRNRGSNRRRNPDAEAFTQRLIDQGVQILRNTSDPARKPKFREFITQYADVRKTARFTLGNYARTAAPADVDTFVDAFKDYAIAIYETQLDKYKGESLKVVGSIDNKPGDYIVKTVVQGGSASEADADRLPHVRRKRRVQVL